LLQNGLVIGPVADRGATTVEVGSGNELVLRERPGYTPELYIGPTARLVVKKSGWLQAQPHTKVTIAGQLLLEDGAYFDQDASVEVQTFGRGRLQTSPPANSAQC
jgi:hypothetical protein